MSTGRTLALAANFVLACGVSVIAKLAPYVSNLPHFVYSSSRVMLSFELPPNGRECLSSRVVNVLYSGAEGPGFKSLQRHCWVTVLGKLLTLIVPLFTKQQNW